MGREQLLQNNFYSLCVKVAVILKSKRKVQLLQFVDTLEGCYKCKDGFVSNF